jgi:lipopolysaccharide transport system ATP-binding protein
VLSLVVGDVLLELMIFSQNLMSEYSIKVENLSKRYTIRHQNGSGDGLRHAIQDLVTAPWRGLRQQGAGSNGHREDSLSAIHHAQSSAEDFWALKGVSFEVKRGEVVGIIGRNGAGKSTLLKILSRITEPTQGRIRIRGRVASLLEVGTGFHPELTGRENIYLNGAILGMTKKEIERKFGEIVAFAEVEKFIDTPVKRYSSGMHVRLAFAVAAHLEPEILLVDEVLAVGDAAFQEKCLGTMQRSASSGRTILFVSHNMSSVQHLCTRAILLESGRISLEGRPSEAIGCYLSGAQQCNRVSTRDWQDRVTTGEARIVQLEIADGKEQLTNNIPVGGTVRFSILTEFYEPVVDPCFGVLVHNAAGESILDIRSSHAGLRLGRIQGHVLLQASVENFGLYPGRYFLSPWITDSNWTRSIDWVKLCCTLEVYPAPGPHGDLQLNPVWGKYWVQSNWRINGL